MPRPLALLAIIAAPIAAPWPALASPPGQDLASAQRGYAIYAQVCSACHSMRAVTYADLAGLGLDHEQIRLLAGHHHAEDTLPSPFPDEAAARAANNGALPPDMSRLALTLPGHAAYIARLLAGYRAPPPGFVRTPGSFYNPVAAGGQIAMPPPLHDNQVAFADDTRATVPQMAHDVATFLTWAAYPHQAERHRLGVSVLLYLALLSGLVFILKRRVWSNVRTR